MRRWASALSSAAIAAVPIAGVVIMAARAVLTLDLPRDRLRWALLLAAPLLLPLPFQWASGQTGLGLAIQALGVALLVFVCAGERRGAVLGFLAALAGLLVVGFGLQASTAHMLASADAGIGSYLTRTSRLGPRDMYWSTAKEWRVDPSVGAVEVSLDLRLVAGSPGSDWYRYHPQMTIAPCEGPTGGGCSRIGVPEAPQDARPLNISRELDTGAPLAGRTFRLLASLRSETQQSTSGCEGLVLQENGGGYRGQCRVVELSGEWTPYAVEWTAPEGVTGSELRVLVSNIASAYEIADVTVEELTDEGWRSLGPLEPQGLQVAVRNVGMGRQDTEAHTLVPTEEWESHRLVLDSAGLVADGLLRLNFQLEGLVGVEVRDLRVVPLGGSEALAPASEGRWNLGFGQPNLLGHSAAATGTAVAALAGAPWVQGLGLLGAFVLVVQSGSRTALVALALFSLLLALQLGRRRFRVALLVGVVVAAAGVAVLAPAPLQRFSSLQDGNAVARSEIRAVAAAAMVQHPLTGLGERSFASYWVEESGGWPNLAPNHAHNFVLQLGAQYGVPGLVAALAFLALLVRYAWVRRRWRGLLVFAPVLVLSLFDHTLFFPGVLGPLLVALQAQPAPERAQGVHQPA